MLTNIKNDLWMEKYRPQTIEELVLPDNTREKLQEFISEKRIPHLMLLGGAGVGKTTIAKILIKEIECDKLELNASSERGIDVIRNKVINFAMMRSLHPWKIVFLDEMDFLTQEAQASLRNVFETYASYVRFICTGNHANKIMKEIKSRCQCIEFEHLDKKSVIKLLQRILKAEDIRFDPDDFLVLVEDCYPDIRSMINALQFDSSHGMFQYRRSFVLQPMAILKDRLKCGALNDIRKMNLDYIGAMRYLFDAVQSNEFTTDKDIVSKSLLIIADHLRDDVISPDREINFAACCIRLIEALGLKVK